MPRRISWVKPAQKVFEKFPIGVQRRMLRGLRVAALGGKSDVAKPTKGLGKGVFEIAIAYRTDAFRAIYAILLGDDVWVVDAFQKKSKHGHATPKRDVERIKARLTEIKRRLK